MMPATYGIGRATRHDRQAIRDICVATCWMGAYRPRMVPHEWAWAEYWTRYFTDAEPRHAWVVRRGADARVVGYLVGTSDVRRFQRYTTALMPALGLRMLLHRLAGYRVNRPALVSVVRSELRDESHLPAWVAREYPGTWHFNLLPEARRKGLGTRLFGCYVDQMRRRGISGIHAQLLSVNPATTAFRRRGDFRLVYRRRLTAFEHAWPVPIELQTWIRRL